MNSPPAPQSIMTLESTICFLFSTSQGTKIVLLSPSSLVTEQISRQGETDVDPVSPFKNPLIGFVCLESVGIPLHTGCIVKYFWIKYLWNIFEVCSLMLEYFTRKYPSNMVRIFLAYFYLEIFLKYEVAQKIQPFHISKGFPLWNIFIIYEPSSDQISTL